MNKTTKRHFKALPKHAKCTGAVIVEMAICLPLMLLVVFGCVDVSSAIFRAQTLTSAAHEGALYGLRQNVTEQEIRDRVSTVLTARGIQNFTVNLKTAGGAFENLESGEPFTIELTSEVNSDHLTARNVSATVTGLRP
jgi:Flp pilus assembly protein TadG